MAKYGRCSPNNGRCRFLQLPREIRDQIYYLTDLFPTGRMMSYVKPEDGAFIKSPGQKKVERIHALYRSPSHLVNPTPVFHICQQIRDEALDFVCRRNVFCFELTDRNTILFDASLSPFLQRIRSLQLAMSGDPLDRYEDRLYKLLGTSCPNLTYLNVFRGPDLCHDVVWMRRNEAITHFIDRIRRAPSMKDIVLGGGSSDQWPAVRHLKGVKYRHFRLMKFEGIPWAPVPKFPKYVLVHTGNGQYFVLSPTQKHSSDD